MTESFRCIWCGISQEKNQLTGNALCPKRPRYREILGPHWFTPEGVSDLRDEGIGMTLKEVMLRCWQEGRASGMATREEIDEWWSSYGHNLQEVFMGQVIKNMDDMRRVFIE